MPQRTYHQDAASEESIPIPTQVERRRDMAALGALISLVEELTAQVHEMSTKLDNHASSLPAEREAIIKKVLAETVPNGDAPGHKRWHESEIERVKARTAFWLKMRDELAKWGLIGFIAWAGYALWQAFLQGPHK